MDGKQIDAPPCVKMGEPMNWCAKRQMAERILGHFALVNEWAGWRFAGRELVSPDGLRICPERLRCLMFDEKRPPGGKVGKERRLAAVIPLRLIGSHEPPPDAA